jgi:hypothetical protein
MGLYEKMKTSPKLESEGIWLQIEDSRMKLARAGGKNTKFTAAAEKIAREHKRALEFMNEQQARPLFAKLYAEVIVLDWLTRAEDGDLDEDGAAAAEDLAKHNRWKRGISGPTGEIVEYCVENVLKTFDDIPDLLRIVKETAEDAALFRQSILKDIEGN